LRPSGGRQLLRAWPVLEHDENIPDDGRELRLLITRHAELLAAPATLMAGVNQHPVHSTRAPNLGHFGIGEPGSPLADPPALSAFGEGAGPALPPDPAGVDEPS